MRSPTSLCHPSTCRFIRPASLLRWLWALAFAMSSFGAFAQGPAALYLKDSVQRIEAWDQLRLFADPSATLSLGQVLPQPFVQPTGPRANLGIQAGNIWLRTTLVVPPGSRGQWWVAVDYPPLDEVEVLLRADGQTVAMARMGDHLLDAGRPAPTRQHATPLPLSPGRSYELILRVRSSSSLLLPVALVQTNALLADEGASHTLQGMAFGICICLAVLTGTRALFTREPLPAWFAVAMGSGALFFFAYYGLAAQYLWPQHAWMTRNASPVLALLLVASLPLFASAALEMQRTHPRSHRALQGGALLAMAVLLLFTLGWLDYAQTLRLASLYIPVAMTLTVPAAMRLARQGDRAARWMFAGWLIYAVAVTISTLLQRGLLPSSPWTVHALQVGTLLDQFTWLIVLSLRAKEAGQAALHAQHEHARLTLVAQTDPLTGLLNRRGLQKALQPAIDGADAGHLTAVFLLDLDGFKGVNDQYGHETGDELLIQLAQRLRGVVRESDLVARLGGDEFVIAVTRLQDRAQAEQIGDKLIHCCDAPFQLGPISTHIGLTAGYALAPLQSHDGSTLIKQADAAMYAAKQAGKARVQCSLALAA